MSYSAMPPSNDLTANGNNGIRLDFRFLQVGVGTSTDMSIAVTSPGGTASFSTLLSVHPTDAFSVFVPFSSFSTTGSFTFADVSTLQVSFNQSDVPAFDFQIDQIVAAQQSNPSFDFGNFPIPASLSGHKYVDSNNNGNRDPGELPIDGVLITLSGVNDLGQTITPVTIATKADGTFLFDSTLFTQLDVNGGVLRPGTYKLTETPPVNFIIGKAHVGSLGGVVSADQLMISSIVTPGDAAGINYDFGELGFTPPFASKRSLLNPAQPVVLTAVYSTTPTAALQVKTATTTVAKVAVKPAPKPVAKKVVAVVKKPAPKTVVKVPLALAPKKQTT